MVTKFTKIIQKYSKNGVFYYILFLLFLLLLCMRWYNMWRLDEIMTFKILFYKCILYPCQS